MGVVVELQDIQKPPRRANVREHDPKDAPLSESNSTVPYGFCQCGCGQQAPLAKQTDNKRGYVKGDPLRYVASHNTRKSVPPTPEEYRAEWEQEHPGIPYGSCWCGCGERTGIAPQTSNGRGYVAGEPVRFLPSHGNNIQLPRLILIVRAKDSSSLIARLVIDRRTSADLQKPRAATRLRSCGTY